MARSRRPNPSTRLRIEGLETRAMLSTANPAAEIAPIETPDPTPIPFGNPASPEDVMFYTTGGGSPTAAPRRMSPALMRAQRLARRWEKADAAAAVGPQVVDTTLISRGDQIVGVSLTFDSPMRADIAADPRAYRAIRITQPNEWLSRLTYQGSGPKVEELRIRAVEYHADDQTAVLWLKDARRATGRFRVGIVTKERVGPRGVRTLALGPLTDTAGHPVRPNPDAVRLPGRNIVYVQPDHSVPFDSPRFHDET